MFLLEPQQQLPILTNLCKMRQENLPHPADIDLEKNVLHLTDARYHGSKAVRQAARTTKTHRDRVLSIHPDLQRLLKDRDHAPDGRVFHGPRGGVLKPDTVRN